MMCAGLLPCVFYCLDGSYVLEKYVKHLRMIVTRQTEYTPVWTSKIAFEIPYNTVFITEPMHFIRVFEYMECATRWRTLSTSETVSHKMPMKKRVWERETEIYIEMKRARKIAILVSNLLDIPLNDRLLWFFQHKSIFNRLIIKIVEWETPNKNSIFYLFHTLLLLFFFCFFIFASQK